MFHKQRFSALLAGLGLPHNNALFEKLSQAYSAAGRYYHGQTHVAECLEHLDRCSALANRPFEIEAALWFHDAIYETTQGDNEEKSAVWAKTSLESLGANAKVCNRVAGMILATKTHHATDPVLPSCWI